VKRLRDHSLSLFFLAAFVLALAGQAMAGHSAYNNEQLDHGGQAISLGRYLTSSNFGQAVMENWQSEYLQFTLYIVLTVWLIQRGSPESKEPGKEGYESDEEQRVGDHANESSPLWAKVGGLRQGIFENSLLLVMGFFFVGSWFAQSVTGWSDHNADQLEHGGEALSWLQFVGSAEFWESTLQNWQSEFLAVGSMVTLTIFLRQRGSPESKPVGAAHHATGVEG
jgi:hypothetical protein